VIYDVFPADGMDIKDDSTFIHAFLADRESGVDENSIVLEIDGLKQNASFLNDESLLLCWISVESLLPEMAHKLSISCADKAGNQNSVFAVFKIFSAMQHLISRNFKAIYVHSPVSEHGLVEVKRVNSEFWEMLKPGMVLTGADWVRMPNSSILSLKDTDNDEIYQLAGMKQKRVAELLLAGNNPTASSSEANNNPDSQEGFTRPKLEFLSVVKPIPPFERVPNVGKAMWIFKQLRGGGDIEIQELIGKSDDSPSIYYLLLEKAGIPVHSDEMIVENPNEGGNGGIYLLLDSGVPQAKSNKITINPILYLTTDKTVWIPLYISSETPDFVSAWYAGARIAQESKE